MRNSLALLYLCLTAALIWGCQPSTDPSPDETSEKQTTSTVTDVSKTEVVVEPPQVEQPVDAEFNQATIPTSLTIGDTAPPVRIDKWITGSSIDGFELGKIHVVEFWATWCAPCRASMPHISELQKKYADDVKFIGVTGEDEQEVEDFLDEPFEDSEEQTWRDVIEYALVLDKDAVTHGSYMRAAKQSGIPTAFIVGRDGHVEWIGHPMNIDEPIERVVAGVWDREVALAELRKQQEIRVAQQKLGKALSTRDWDAALDIIDELGAKNPGDIRLRMTQFELLIKAERVEEASRLAADLGDQYWEEANVLNALAWGVATEIPSESQDLELALKLAQRANELSHESDSSVLDTLARIHYELGNLDQAIVCQQKAVDLSTQPGWKQTLDDYLAERQAGEETAGDESEVDVSDNDATEDDAAE